MEDFSKCLDISRTLSLLCFILGIFSPSEGNIISEVVGNTVYLHCSNKSIGAPLIQLTWKKSNVPLFTFQPKTPLHASKEATRLSLNMTMSESWLYALVIERVQKSHTGNYTCESNTESGLSEQKWELLITEGTKETGNWGELMIPVAVTIPCVCCLIFIITLTILRVCKQRAQNSHSPAAEMNDQPEDIYENCLETDVDRRSGYNRPNHYIPRVC